MKLKKGKWMALTVAVLMGMSAFTSVSADEGQTNTTFIKGELNGIPGITFSNDFAKYNVWNSAKNAYVFTKDSLIKTNEGIFAEKKSVKIMAKGVTLTLIPQQFKNKHGEHGNLGGIQINVDREYKAREGTHLPAKDVSPDIGIDIEVGKFIIDIDPDKNASIKKEGIYYDTYGIASVSRGGNKVNIKGDVDVTVKNGYRTKRGLSFTGGITTMHQGHINIDGNAKVTVEVKNGHDSPHYLVNGIFAGLNYTPDKYGSDINITGNVDVKSNGTGIQATGSSFLTIGGGGTVTIDKKTRHYSLLAEEGFISMNVKLDRLSEGRTDEMPKVESVGSAVTKIYGDVKFNNHESRGTTNSGLAPSIINLALTTSDSRLDGVVIDDFKEEPTADPKKQWARSLSGLNLYLQNGAVWKNEMWGNHQSSFTGSKVRSIIGGDDIKKAGIIEQNDSNDITVKSFEKHIKVIYQQGKDNPNFFKGGAIRIKSAKENSSITLRANLRGFKMPGQGESNVYDAALNALAGKLYYEGKDGHLTGKVEVAEGLMAEAWSKDISFKADGQGEYKAQKSENPSGPVVPSGSNPIPAAPSADEGQTNTTFIKGELNGIPGITFSNDFAKYHVWDSAKNAYVFTKDSLIKTNEGIFAEKKSVKIMAKGVTLTMTPQKFKNKHGHHGNLGGIQINVDREYKGREGTHLPAGDVSPDIGIDIEVGKFVIDIDPNKNTSIKNKGIYYDTYGIASVSRGGNKVNIKGDVDVTVKNGYRTERGFSFTGGITTMHQGHINIDGNAKVTVDVENGHNLAHYLVNGIFAGLNYTPDKYGSDINITGNVEVKSNGTGIQATGSSFLTIGGGGTVTIDKKTQHYSLLAEEGFISMNVKLNRLSEGRTDEMPKVESVGSAVTKIYGDVKFNNHESRGTTNSGLAPSIINLALTTSDSRLEGVVIDDFKEEPTADPKKQWARSLSGLNLYLQNEAVWKNEMWGNHQSSFTGSKVRSIIGGDDIKKAGIIEQNDSNDITVKSFEKHIKVIYQQGKDNPNFFKGGAIRIKSAKENSSITLRANLRDFKMPGQGESNVYDAALNALAGKLYYEGKDGHLTGKVEVAESLMAEAWSKDISFKADGQGEYKAQKSENPSGPVVPPVKPGSDTIPSAPSVEKSSMQDKGDHYLIEKKTNGESVGFELRANKDVTWEKTVKVDVEGVGNNGILTHNRVIGINVLFASVLTANGDVVVSVKNSKPAISGEHFRGRDLAHYYMSGIYVGNEMAEEEPYDHDPAMLIKGKVDLDVVGVALQATKHGIIKVLGGGKIVTHKLDESASYAMLAEESRIYMNTGEDGQNPGTNNVDIKGNIAILNKDYGHEPNEGKRDSIISVGLTTKDSKLEGGILNEFEEKGDNPKDSGIDLYLQNGATWENGWLWTHRPEVSSRPEGSDPKDYLYKGSKVRNLIGGESEEKAGIIYQNEDKDITIKNLSGHVKVIYKQNATNDKAFDGGAIRIKKAKENSRIILRANIKDFQMPQDREVVNYDDVLNTLAGKLFYEAQDGYLTGRVEVAEGLMTDALGGDIAFKAGGQGELKAGTISKQTPSHSGTTPGQTPGQGGTTPGQTPGQGGTTPGQDPNFETSVMKGIRSTMVSTGMISTGAFWSAQNNDVERRMGDIRLAQTETGLWAKYQGGSSEYNDTDSREKAVHVDQTYNAIQVGYDKSVGDWIVGGTFSYGTTKDKYIDNRDTGKLNGTGKETGVSGGVYGTLKQKDGSYLDVIAKVGQIKNNYEVYTKDWDKDKKNDDKVNSEYKVNGTSLSVEYGKRIEREGFYVEPSMELTVNRVAGHSEEVTSEVHKYKMKITQDDMTSVVGRIGVGIGQNYENGHIYGKLSLAHEFNGDIMTTFSAGNKEEVVKLSLRGTWLDVEMGGSYRLSKDSYFYGSFTKNFGAKLNNKWRLDAGIRLAF